MIIKKKRIRNLSSLSFIKTGQLVRFGVADINRFKVKCNDIGFTSNLEIGETILPDKVGPVSRRNAEGQYIPEKDKEKEIVYYPREWTRQQWVGRGETEEVTDTVYIPVERYQRKFIPPQCIELTILNDKHRNKLILSQKIKFVEENEKLMVHTVNLILELFGECQVFQDDLEQISNPKIRRLSWEILPKGDYPWDKLVKDITPFINRARKSNRNLIYKRLKKLHKYKPDFKAYGKAGFSGYIVFGYEDKGLYILESVYTNNATYVFTSNWEEFSRLTKAEILNNNYQEYRIIHTKEWEAEIAKLLG
ncbi:hypothetical protein [Crassaminicella indica]|uniref:Uncharacterized protein n=1 Tax=Crassaminicella indica TaxID=2855394 RepID=A0ABX8RFK3_9CLOT|nr:hypothetical protein [Crassaminicella indica]QXM05721.1 hypothetical protein KVH43_10145 [Crassaminicella indica]